MIVKYYKLEQDTILKIDYIRSKLFAETGRYHTFNEVFQKCIEAYAAYNRTPIPEGLTK
jgi:hypothetical protein